MASVWSTFTFVLLPPAVILLFLMTIPSPGLKGNRAIVKIGDVVFGVRVGPLSIYPSARRWSVFSIITAISFIVLLGEFSAPITAEMAEILAKLW
ncbi:hypothetical protein BBJ28_00009175 [Nothophytophthora sp. Chile5]|nr:hypothetical protein BBJ28_00009175 [Nothophytophthora sp. Chile5]